jgi:hypothetical protein
MKGGTPARPARRGWSPRPSAQAKSGRYGADAVPHLLDRIDVQLEACASAVFAQPRADADPQFSRSRIFRRA